MKHLNFLREAAKFTAGLVLGDMLVGVWVATDKLYNLNFWGIPLTPTFTTGWIVLDILFLLWLIHYGWRIRLPLSPTKRIMLMIAGILLLTVSGLHLLRVMFGINILIGVVDIPLWFSVIGTFVTALLGYSSIYFSLHN